MKKIKRKLKQKKIMINEDIQKNLIEDLKRLGMKPKTALRKAIQLILRGAENGKRN
ncbi:hypothetical protein [Fusobacterium varium]|uniref:hypothetical protein n=1 Tax=Fusobacterium varium TaxID=856 RepID=UPI003F12A061